MESVLAVGSGLLVLALAVAASAEEPAPRQRPFELGLSGAYSTGPQSLWALPVKLDLGYRVSPRWSVGAYGEVGFIDASPSQAADVDQTIEGHHYRVGVEARYHSATGSRLKPWLGFGFGYDVLSASRRSRDSYPHADGSAAEPDFVSPLRASGFELGHVQLGIEFAIAPAFGMGPFVGASVAVYRNRRGFEHELSQNSSDLDVWGNFGLQTALRL